MNPRLSLNQATIKYADLATALRVTRAAGIGAIGLWREPVAEVGSRPPPPWWPTPACGCRACAAGASSPRPTRRCAASRWTRTDAPSTRRPRSSPPRRPDPRPCSSSWPAGCPRTTGTSPAPVPGPGTPSAPSSRTPRRGRVLGQPMHPIYTADRGVIPTLAAALDVAEQFPASVVGVVVDTFHVWWDPQLDEQVRRAGRDGRIAAYQVCDWITPLPPDALLARGRWGGPRRLPRGHAARRRGRPRATWRSRSSTRRSGMPTCWRSPGARRGRSRPPSASKISSSPSTAANRSP